MQGLYAQGGASGQWLTDEHRVSGSENEKSGLTSPQSRLYKVSTSCQATHYGQARCWSCVKIGPEGKDGFSW